MLANQIGLTSKVVSERHYYASQTKSTAGDVAKRFRKSGYNVSAKEIVNLYKTITGREPEWHHSGFYGGAKNKTMGRTFFFSENDIEILKANVQSLNKKENNNQQIDIFVKGFYYIWDHDYSGRNRKKVNYKVLQAYEGSMSNVPKNFTHCTDLQYLNVLNNVGKRYYGWDEPKTYEF